MRFELGDLVRDTSDNTTGKAIGFACNNKFVKVKWRHADGTYLRPSQPLFHTPVAQVVLAGPIGYLQQEVSILDALHVALALKIENLK